MTLEIGLGVAARPTRRQVLRLTLQDSVTVLQIVFLFVSLKITFKTNIIENIVIFARRPGKCWIIENQKRQGSVSIGFFRIRFYNFRRWISRFVRISMFPILLSRLKYPYIRFICFRVIWIFLVFARPLNFFFFYYRVYLYKSQPWWNFGARVLLALRT